MNFLKIEVEWCLILIERDIYSYILIRCPAQPNIKHLSCNKQPQEPITRSLQLPHISVTAFSQTDLFSV